MNFINVKPELLDATYWLFRLDYKHELTSPTSSQGGMDMFIIKSTKIYSVKQVLSLTKPIIIGGTKTSLLETDFADIAVGTSTSPFRSSKLFASLGEDMQSNIAKYMQRIVGALSTIESATLNASQTTGEGTDTSAFSAEEKEARRRLEKAATRLKNAFAEVNSPEEQGDYLPAYLEKDLPEEVKAFMDENSFAF